MPKHTSSDTQTNPCDFLGTNHMKHIAEKVAERHIYMHRQHEDALQALRENISVVEILFIQQI